MHSKPTASLSSSLLARKGHAKPAMRPQGFVSLTPNGQDDLGWNDMGEEYPTQVRPAHEPIDPVAPPTVLVQRAELAEQIAPRPTPIVEPAHEAPEPEPVAELAPEPITPEPFVQAAPVEAPMPALEPAPFPSAEPVKKAPKAEAKVRKSKAAFTLRLDAERHLRLRLASAVSNRSAQQIVTEALDAFLDSLTEIDALACQLAARGGN